MDNSLLKDVWTQQREWSATANRLKAQIARWRKIVLSFAIAGAFLSTLSTQLPYEIAQHIVALLGAALLTTIPLITLRKLSAKRTEEWTRTRSVSEGLKAEIYSFLARAHPYDSTDESADRTLRERSYEITESAEDLVKYLSAAQVDSKSPPVFRAPEDYLKQRVADQIDWYKKKARVHMNRASQLRTIEFYLAFAAALLAGATGVVGNSFLIGGLSLDVGVWVAVLTTIGGTLTTHIAAERYDHIVTSYSATAHQLRHLKMQWPPTEGNRPPSPAWSQFVHQCEEAISKENESWMAKWVKNHK